MRANRPGPAGCHRVAARRQRAAWPDGQSGRRHALPPDGHSM